MKRYTQLSPNTRQLLRNWLVIFVILFASWLVIQSPLFQRQAPPDAKLTDLNSLEQFQTQFNKDQGKPRLILIGAPT